MKIGKAVITAAGRQQRALPLQTLIDRDGVQKSVLRVIVEEAVRGGVDDICVVVCPGDEALYASAAGDVAARLTFIPQQEPRGYGHAIYCARDFVGDQPFLHMVGDHLWVSRTGPGLRRAAAGGRRGRGVRGLSGAGLARDVAALLWRPWAAAACRGGRICTPSKM